MKKKKNYYIQFDTHTFTLSLSLSLSLLLSRKYIKNPKKEISHQKMYLTPKPSHKIAQIIEL
jgi:hypothetical protein